MKTLFSIVLLSLGVLLSLNANAVIETYEFENESQRARYHKFVDELRCPKCQNQNLSGSNSPIAKDLRRELHRMITEGEDNKAITSFMVQRYGNFVLYEPPLDSKTIVLWATPFILLMLAFIGLGIFLRPGASSEELSMPLNEKEQKALDKLLKRYG